jgi:hypothetical protein
MKDTKTRRAVWNGSRLGDSTDDLTEERCKDTEPDPEVLAKQITDPLIEAVRKELEKIDVTPYKK